MNTVLQKIDLNNLDKSTWESFRFEEITNRVAEGVDPNTTTLEMYVGLEHINAEDIHIRRFGTPSDVGGGKLKCYPGDVIFGKRRAYLRKAAIADFEGICSAHAFVFRANSKVIDPKLYPFFLHSDQFMHRAVDISVGGLSPTINWGDLKGQEFLLPPKAEQARLAKLLWAMDEVIEKQIKSIELLKIFNQTKLKDLLFKHKNESGWGNVKLKDVFDKISKRNKSIESSNVLTISAQHGLVNQEDYFNRSVSSKDLSNYFLLQKGDFAYNKSYSDGYPAGAIKVLELYNDGVVSPLYICFRPKCSKFLSHYYKHLFEFGHLNKQILSIAKEGARNHGLLNVSSTDLFELIVPKPPESVLKNILPVIDKIIESTITSKKLLSASQSLQKSLINQIF